MPRRIATRLSRRLGEQALRQRSGLKAAVGVALVLLGGAALAAPSVSAVVSVKFAGAILLAAGLFQAALALTAHRDDAPARSPAVSLANLVAGGVFLSAPRASILTLSLVLAVAYAVVGSYKAVTATLRRYPHWRWMAVLGLLLAAFGVLIGLRWPESGMKVIGRFVGINLIVEGVTWLMIVRHALKSAGPRVTIAPPAEAHVDQKGPVRK